MAFDDREMNQDETTTLWRPQRSGYPSQSDGEEMANGQNEADWSYLKRGLMEILAQQRTPPSPNGEYYQRVFPSLPKPEPEPHIGYQIVALAYPEGSPRRARLSGTPKGPVDRLREVIRSARNLPRASLRLIQDPQASNSGFGQPQEQQGIFSTFYPGGKESMMGLQKATKGANSFPVAKASSEQPFVGTTVERPALQPLSTRYAFSGQSSSQSTSQQQKPEQAQPPPSLNPEQRSAVQAQQPFRRWQPPGEPLRNPTFFGGTQSAEPQPEPSWSEIREYIAQEARAYGVPVKLAEAVVRHETNFNIHSNVVLKRDKKGKPTEEDIGIMAVNSSNKWSLAGPEGFGFRVDMNRVKSDWKYNVHVGMAILRNAYAAAALNTVGTENIARETYARYNSHDHWKQLYTVPGGVVSRHVHLFMKSWHKYYDEK